MFIDKNNTVYMPKYRQQLVGIWPEGSPNSTRDMSANGETPMGVFLSHTGALYHLSDGPHWGVFLWEESISNFTMVMKTPSQCRGIFVDLANNL